ncbi:MAG: T9SS type A sorting domain-containing protein, partial [Bacteroidetes bacterium]|nr:T9SS type A sorting domain-containing protein [Bacteroidota bacterium]
PWDLFTRIEKDVPGGAHVGNIHFPPNGTSDYNYGNTTLVTSYAENWYRYPLLLDQSSKVNVQTWIYQPGEPLAEGNDHLGFLRWWYGHIPRYEGVSDGVLNNWWHYALDYEAAVALAKSTPPVGIFDQMRNFPKGFNLEQNYPNPFNPATIINYTLENQSYVSLKIFDMLGREVAKLIDEPMSPGNHAVQWNAQGFSSGVYFYQLKTGSIIQTKKMILLR